MEEVGSPEPGDSLPDEIPQDPDDLGGPRRRGADHRSRGRARGRGRRGRWSRRPSRGSGRGGGSRHRGGPEAGDALDDLLGDLDQGANDPAAADTDLDDLLGDLEEEAEDTGADDLDDLLGDLATDAPDPDTGGEAAPAGATLTGEPEFAYGTLSGDRPAPNGSTANASASRSLAILRPCRARLIETGDALAARRATLLDPDTVEDVIESFATDLVLPIGREGAGVAVSLKGLDSLHPDELYENVDLFSELVGLRQQLQSGATAETPPLPSGPGPRSTARGRGRRKAARAARRCGPT